MTSAKLVTCTSSKRNARWIDARSLESICKLRSLLSFHAIDRNRERSEWLRSCTLRNPSLILSPLLESGVKSSDDILMMPLAGRKLHDDSISQRNGNRMRINDRKVTLEQIDDIIEKRHEIHSDRASPKIIQNGKEDKAR